MFRLISVDKVGVDFIIKPQTTSAKNRGHAFPGVLKDKYICERTRDISHMIRTVDGSAYKYGRQ